MPPPDRPPNAARLAIEVRGVVQGVGFRPFVYNAARFRGLSGWVRNDSDAVRIEVQGPPEDLEAFCRTLRSHPPPQSTIDAIEVAETALQPEAGRFEIRTSGEGASPRPAIPADLATCGQCLAEIHTPGERRYRYSFTNCTNCGPRWSIIEAVPYDRQRTSMARFAMCDECRRQYEDPADRRFHAQPIACPNCGPALELLDPEGRRLAAGDEALKMAAGAVLAGEILAIQGLGGFQLVVDATSGQAVERLRQRKQRPDKPLAVMLLSADEVRARCELLPDEERELRSHQAPILLLRRRPDADALSDLTERVAPGNPYLGVMLPYTPLHHLLVDAVGRPIVCTSGNLSEEPMAITTEDAVDRLGRIADLFLVHDRPIVRPVDDSVARFGAGGLQLLRRARGYAPLPISLGFEATPLLAVGGHLKNTVAVSLGSQAIVGPHVGDLDNLLSVEVHRRVIDDLVAFFQIEPQSVACDLHPDYASTGEAERLAAAWGVPLVRVQHHHAHIAACMAEHGLEGPVLGFSWDGTGYGLDGTVWGGEVLHCEGAEFRRVGHLRTFPLAGGDQAVRQPRRSALGLLFEVFGAAAAEHAGAWFTRSELETLLAMLQRGVRCPRTSSMGRLFDAVAAICGLPAVISFEGQAAMALEFAADWAVEEAYPVSLFASGEATGAIDWEPMLRGVLADRAAGVSLRIISAKVHNALAEAALAAARAWGGRCVVLTGGCFQNALLTERLCRRLSDDGFDVYTHRRVPPGDGGIALGQLYIAASRIKETCHVPGNSR